MSTLSTAIVLTVLFTVPLEVIKVGSFVPSVFSLVIYVVPEPEYVVKAPPTYKLPVLSNCISVTVLLNPAVAPVPMLKEVLIEPLGFYLTIRFMLVDPE